LDSFKYVPPACADGTNFKDLSPNFFVDCPQNKSSYNN